MVSKVTIFSSLLLLPVLFGSNLTFKNKESKTIVNKSDNKSDNNIESFVLRSFKFYNKKTKIKTVKKFIEVCDSFNLTKNIKKLTAQICLESGAKQILNGKVIESSGNALGICQVTPYTAYLYFKNVISKDDRLLKSLGGEDYKRILSIKNKFKRRKEIKKWLGSETNNLIMYGYIMNHCIKKYGGLINSLVTYSKGPYFLKKCLKNKTDLCELSYINSINKINISLKTLDN